MERELEKSLRRGIKEEHESDELDSKLFRLSQQAYQSSTAYLDDFKDKFIRRYNMYNSIHHTGEKYLKEKYGKSKHYVGKTHEFVKNQLSQVIQAYFQNPDFLSYDPVNDHDVIAVMSAEYYTAVINYRLEQDNNWWQRFIHISYTSEIMHNLAVAKVDWNTDKKRPTAIPILLERFRVDPFADPLDPIGTSPYLIYIQEMYVSDIKRKMNKSNKNPWLQLDDDKLKKSPVNSAGFETDLNESRYKEGSEQSKANGSISDELAKVFVHENIFKLEDKDYVFYTLGTYEMLSPVYELEEVYPQGRPYVMGSIFPEENKIYSASLLDHAYEPQKQLNDLTNTLYDAIKISTFPITLIKAQSGLDANAYANAGAGTTLLSRNPQTDLYQITKQTQPQSLKNEIPFVMNQFDAILGGVSSSSNAAGSNSETATGQNMAVQVQNQVTEMYLRMFHESFIVPVLKLILKCEQIYGLKDTKFINKIFDREQLVERFAERLTKAGFDPRTNEFQIDKQFVEAELDLYVNIGMGATSPQQRFERLIAGMAQIRQAFPNIDQQMNVEEWIKEIMSIQGYKNHSRFFKSSIDSTIEQLNSEKAALQEELKLAKKKTPEEVAVDIKYREAEIEKIRAEIVQIQATTNLSEAKTIKENVQSQYGAMEAAEIIVSVPEVVQAGDQVLHNAGYKHGSDTTLGGFIPEDYQNFTNMPMQPQMQPQMDQNINPSMENPLDKQNNNPMYPAKPDSAFKGFNSGIQTGNE